MYPTISRPTCITKSSATLIDNILISQSLIEKFTSNIILDDISDHLSSILSLQDMNLARSEPITITSRDTRERNLKTLERELACVDWTDMLDSNDVNISTNRMHDLLVEKLTITYPLRLGKLSSKALEKNPG